MSDRLKMADGKAEVGHIGDWTEYLHVIDEKLANAITLMIEAIESGTLVGFSHG